MQLKAPSEAPVITVWGVEALPVFSYLSPVSVFLQSLYLRRLSTDLKGEKGE